MPEAYTCKVCDYGMDHPVDSCPICGEPFYWMVVPRVPLHEAQIIAFLQTMEDITQGEISRNFLNHGKQLWLPYTFWQLDPHGEVLNTFPWISEIRLVQHENPEKRSFFEEKDPEEDGRSEFDTQPLKVRKPLPKASPEPAIGPRHLPASQRLRAPISARHPKQAGLAWGRMFAPCMVALMLILLALSYFNLLHYRNENQIRSRPNDRAILP
ncbi:MAG: hypothetical protein H6510_00045 [Acidobacteria bacterium]|nr:hypothetical protein [Acidobacteriota bacterium]MCB9396177.1 hypothetical protein [Acidobacteriota bacterium]